MISLFDGAMILIMALFVFGACLPLGGVSPELVTPAFALGLTLALLWVARLLSDGAARLKASPMNLPVGLFFLYAVIRYFTSPIEYEGRIELFHVGVCAAIYFICANQFGSSRDRLIFLFVLAGLAIFQSGFGLWQALTKSDAIFHWLRPESYRGRASGTFVCPNHLAGFLEIVLGMVVARLALVRAEHGSVEKSVVIKILLVYSAIMVAAGILFSLSRAGWLAAAAGLVVFALWGEHNWRRNAVKLALVFGILATAVFLVLNSDAGRTRLHSTFNSGPEGKVELRDITLGTRTVLWKDTLKMIQANPFFGTGPGSWQYFYQRDKNFGIIMNPEYTHNDYLNLLSDYGLVGFVLVGWAFWAFFRHAYSASRLPEAPEQRAFATGAVIAVSALLVHSFFDFNFHIPANAFLIAALMGFTAATGGKEQRFPARLAGAWRFPVAATALVIAAVGAAAFVPTVLAAHYVDVAHRLKERLEYDWAISEGEKAVRIDPRNPHAQIKLGELRLIQAALRPGPENESSRSEIALAAVQDFDNALDINFRLTAAWLGRGRAYELAGEGEKALESYERALVEDRANYAAYFRIGCYYRDRGDMKRADEAFDMSVWLQSTLDPAPQLNLMEIRSQ